jgi:hypothetical protein
MARCPRDDAARRDSRVRIRGEKTVACVRSKTHVRWRCVDDRFKEVASSRFESKPWRSLVAAVELRPARGIDGQKRCSTDATVRAECSARCPFASGCRRDWHPSGYACRTSSTIPREASPAFFDRGSIGRNGALGRDPTAPSLGGRSDRRRIRRRFGERPNTAHSIDGNGGRARRREDRSRVASGERVPRLRRCDAFSSLPGKKDRSGRSSPSHFGAGRTASCRGASRAR